MQDTLPTSLPEDVQSDRPALSEDMLLDLLGMDDERLQLMLASVENHDALVQDILQSLQEREGQSDLLPDAPEDPEALSVYIRDEVRKLHEHLLEKKEVLADKAARFAAIEDDPEKKTLMSRALQTVKNGWETIKENKGKVLIVLAILAVAGLTWYYWEYLMTLLPGEWGLGTAEAAEGGRTLEEAIGAAEAAKAMKAVDLAIVDRSIFFEGKEYTLEALSDLISEIRAADPDKFFNVYLHESSRAGTEEALQNLLIEKGVADTALWTGGLQ